MWRKYGIRPCQFGGFVLISFHHCFKFCMMQTCTVFVNRPPCRVSQCTEAVMEKQSVEAVEVLICWYCQLLDKYIEVQDGSNVRQSSNMCYVLRQRIEKLVYWNTCSSMPGPHAMVTMCDTEAFNVETQLYLRFPVHDQIYSQRLWGSWD